MHKFGVPPSLIEAVKSIVNPAKKETIAEGQSNICPVCEHDPCICETGQHIDEASSAAQQAAIAIAMKKAGKKPKDMQEAEGGGTSIKDPKDQATAQAARAKITLQSAMLKLKQAKEREALAKKKKSIKESFSQAQIDKMKDEYSKINTIDPSSPNYKKLIATLDKLDKPTLEKLAGAGIKFVSGLAKNRVSRKTVKEALSDKQKQLDKNKNGKIDGDDLAKLRGEELSDKQKKIDLNKNGKIDGSDLAKLRKEEVEIDEAKSDYEIYHKDFSTAVQHAIKTAEKRGYEVDMDDWHDKVATGPRKPSEGKTNSYSIKLSKAGKPQKKALQMQVYNKGGQNPYELNMYIEATEFKQGGEELAKKFEKAFAKSGVKAKIKMKTVGNISVNEEDKKAEATSTDNKKSVKAGDKLTGKKEPITIEPEIQTNKQ